MREDLSYLDCFVLLCETMSFSETAELMSVSQPSVSRQIKLLEERLGTTLFVRDKHSVHLTTTGKELKSRLAPLIKEVQQILKSVREKSERVEGLLSIGTLTEIGQSSLFPLFMEFHKQHRDVELVVEYLKEFEVVEKVKKGELQFGVVTQALDVESVRSYELMRERAVIVTRAENKKLVRAPEQEEFVTYREKDPLLAAFFKKHVPAFNLRMLRTPITVNSHRSMIDALLGSDCVAVMPHQSVENELKEGVLRVAYPKVLEGKLFLITLDNSMIERKNSLFCKFLLEACRKSHDHHAS